MSIADIKKKTKLSLDKMYDNESVGKTVQHNVQENSSEKESLIKTDYRSQNSSEKNKSIKYPCKMTFYMTQEIYDAFNLVYAKRLISKRKVDKGALFCEMVQSFIENEN